MNNATKNLPQPDTPVLALDQDDNWVIAIYVPRHTKEQFCGVDGLDDWADNRIESSGAYWADYDFDNDTFYWLQGWYEVHRHMGDVGYWLIDDGVKGWQELPPKPSKIG